MKRSSERKWIVVSKETWQRLWELKLKYGCKSINEVIKHLLEKAE